VPAEQLEGGDPQEAFFRVTVLEEELRVMAPDLGAIQVSWISADGVFPITPGHTVCCRISQCFG
jgi:hypothetical protein